MLVIKNSHEMVAYSRQSKANGKSIGFVPTMGALHDGHIKLVKRSGQENDLTLVSIFVNPLQFNNPGDLAAYPRDLDEDLSLLDQAGVAAVFCPEPAEMYPNEPVVTIGFGQLETVLEGEYRPGHFKGVGIVVTKLFNIVQPDRAYFGLKDLQQYLLIKKMVRDLSFPIQIIGVETQRTPAGLALSSRNRRLSKAGLSTAENIYKGLQMAQSLILSQTSPDRTLNELLEFYRSISGLTIEYCVIVDGNTLKELTTFERNQELAVCVAAFVEDVRLIDNLYLHLH